MAEFVTLHGLEQLQRNLRELPANVARNVLRGTARAGARVIQVEAKIAAGRGGATAPNIRTGTLRRSIIIRHDRARSAMHQQVFVVAVRGGRTRKRGNTVANRRKGVVGQVYHEDGAAFYGRFLEFGTSKMTARPFMRPAWEARKAAALDTMRRYLTERLAQEAARLRR